MSGELSKNLRRLEQFLLGEALNDDAMLLSELDGFLAAVIVCPDRIAPSEWLPVIWGDEGPVFETERQAQTVTGLIMGHYNDIIGQLDRGRYRPIYDIDLDETVLWELWIEGYWRAMRLRPKAWSNLAQDEDEDLQRALFVLTRLGEFAEHPDDFEPMEFDEELEGLAPDMIVSHVEILHRFTRARSNPSVTPANEIQAKVGRNDPCPCGSGKKFKKCCLNGPSSRG